MLIMSPNTFVRKNTNPYEYVKVRENENVDSVETLR